MREAPSLALITALQDMGARVRAFDPAGMAQARPLLENVTYCANPYDCAEAADALVIATEWEQFRTRSRALARPNGLPSGRRSTEYLPAGRYAQAWLCLCVHRKGPAGAGFCRR